MGMPVIRAGGAGPKMVVDTHQRRIMGEDFPAVPGGQELLRNTGKKEPLIFLLHGDILLTSTGCMERKHPPPERSVGGGCTGERIRLFQRRRLLPARKDIYGRARFRRLHTPGPRCRCCGCRAFHRGGLRRWCRARPGTSGRRG